MCSGGTQLVPRPSKDLTEYKGILQIAEADLIPNYTDFLLIFNVSDMVVIAREGINAQVPAVLHALFTRTKHF